MSNQDYIRGQNNGIIIGLCMGGVTIQITKTSDGALGYVTRNSQQINLPKIIRLTHVAQQNKPILSLESSTLKFIMPILIQPIPYITIYEKY